MQIRFWLVLLVSIWQVEGIVVSRQDNNYDIVVYLNGKPLQANSRLDMPSFQQTSGVVLPNGQRVAPTMQLNSNGQMQIVPTPNGMSNMVITIQRTYFAPLSGK